MDASREPSNLASDPLDELHKLRHEPSTATFKTMETMDSIDQYQPTLPQDTMEPATPRFAITSPEGETDMVEDISALDYHNFLATGALGDEDENVGAGEATEPANDHVENLAPSDPEIAQVENVEGPTRINYTMNFGNGREKMYRIMNAAIQTLDTILPNIVPPEDPPTTTANTTPGVIAHHEFSAPPTILKTTTPTLDMAFEFRCESFQPTRFLKKGAEQFTYTYRVEPKGGYKDNQPNRGWYRISRLRWEHIPGFWIEVHIEAKTTLTKILKKRNAQLTTNMTSIKKEGVIPEPNIHQVAFRIVQNMLHALPLIGRIVPPDPAEGPRYTEPPFLQLFIKSEVRLKTNKEQAIYKALHDKRDTHLACQSVAVLEVLFSYLDVYDAFNLGLTCQRLHHVYLKVKEGKKVAKFEVGQYARDGTDLELGLRIHSPARRVGGRRRNGKH